MNYEPSSPEAFAYFNIVRDKPPARAAGEPLGAGVRRARDKAANKEAAAAAKSAFRSREWVIMGAGPV